MRNITQQRKRLNFLSKVFLILIMIVSSKLDGHTGVFIHENKEPSMTELSYIDTALPDKEILASSIEKDKIGIFHLFSHGRSGELLINNKWLNASEIAYWFSNISGDENVNELYIYGCEFAKGEDGEQAIAYLQRTLGIPVAASINITGKGGDWILETGGLSNPLVNIDYNYSLQVNVVLPINGGTLDSFTSEFGAGYEAANLTNGVTNENGWSCATFPNGNPPSFQNFFYSIDGAFLEYVVLHSGLGDGEDTWSKDFEVWTSIDGISYTKRAEGVVPQALNQSIQVSLGAQPVLANYVQLSITSGWETTGWWLLGEFEVFGCIDFDLTGTSATTPVVAGNASTVTLANTTTTSLPTGAYTVTYDLSAPNAATGLTAAMTVSVAGTGTFTTSSLVNTGTTTVTVTNLLSGVCTNSISANNTDDILVVANADLSIEKASSNYTPNLGSNITFTLTAENLGPTDATGVVVNDLLSDGFTIFGTPVASVGTYVTGTGVWTIGNLNNTATATLSIVATVNCAAGYAESDYTNTATISGNETDGNSSNNSASVIIDPQSTISADIEVCFGETADLTDNTPCNIPSGTTVTWHDATPATSLNKVGTPTAVGAGTYYVSFEDAVNGCYSPTTAFTVTVKPELVFSTGITHALCNGQSSGSISVYVSGGSAPFEYKLNAGSYSSSNTFNGLAANTYTVWVKDVNDCESSSSVTINEPTALSLTPTETDPTCYSDGSITLVVSGGTSPYSFNWADLSGTSNPMDRIGLPGGDYVVTVTDDNGCTVSSGTLNLAIPSCVGIDVCKSDAASVFSTTPDPANTSYTWTVTPSGAVITGNGNPSISINWTTETPGAFTVCVTATNNCGTSSQSCQTVYVNEPSASALADLACEGGDLQLFASGGDSYAWSGPNSFTSSSGNPLLYGVTQATNGGTYTVTVTSSDGCVATDDVLVAVQPSPSVSSSISTPACGVSTGSIDITPSGGTPGYTYLWSNGAITQDVSSLYSGSYVVTVTDSQGCEAISTESVSNLGGPTVSGVVTNVDCNGNSTGSIVLTATGTATITYLWSNGATTKDVSTLSAGSYSVDVTDGNSCLSSASFEISSPDLLSLDYTQVNVNCFGQSTGSINLIVSGGTPTYLYSWTGPNSYTNNIEDISTLAAGTYNVTVTDDNSCTVSTSVILSEPTSALSVSSTVTGVSCNGGSDGQIILTVTGGTEPNTYSWTGPTFTATTKDILGRAAGDYNVTVTDANSCTSSLTSISITEPVTLAISSTKVDVSCNGGSNGSIDLTVSDGTSPYTYSWSTGATTQDITGITPGSYGVTVTDANDCSASTSASITEPTVLAASAVATNADCNGTSNGSIALTASGGNGTNTFLWSNAATTEDLSSIAAGNYSVTVTDSKGCTAVESAVVTEPTILSVSGVVTNVLCNGNSTGAIDITPSGGSGSYSYNWGGAITTQDRTSLAAGNYSVTVSEQANSSCLVTADYTITQPSALSLSMANINVSCFNGGDGSINLTVSGGFGPYTYSWTGPNSFTATSQDITDLVIGSYLVTVTDANSCTGTLTSAFISAPTLLTLSAANTEVSCKGGSNGTITLTVGGGTTPYAYSWSNGLTTQNLTGLNSSTFSVTLTDANGCNETVSQTIDQPSTEIELFASTIDASSCGGSTGAIDLDVVNGDGPFTYAWTGGLAAIQDPTGVAAGTYTVTVTDSNPCIATLPVTVSVAPAISVTVSAIDRNCSTANGSVYAIVTGGVSPYSYEWEKDNVAYGTTVQGQLLLDVGSYDVTVTDLNTCTATGNGSVSEPPSCLPPVAVDDYLYAPCTVNGDVSTNDSDPDFTLPLEYIPVTVPSPAQGILQWASNYDGSYTFSPGPGYNGTFSIDYEVCDATDLCAEGTLTITVSTDLDVQINTYNHVYCNGDATGAATATASGGVSPYSYLWSNGATTASITGLTQGLYTVTVTDVPLCDRTAQISINQPSFPVGITVNSTDDFVCFGESTGSISVTGTGGTSPYQYKLDAGGTYGSSGDLTGIDAGSHTVYVKDDNDCVEAYDFTVTTNASAVSISSTVVDPTTNVSTDGSISLTVTGGTGPYTYNWTKDGTFYSSSEDISSLSNGVYRVTVTENVGCTGIAQFELLTDVNYDFGDAPDPTYPTLDASSGAKHVNDATTFLGSLIDSEADGQPNSDATGDGADEDGVTLPPSIIAGADITITVNASVVGYLNAWIDFNDDGDWADTGEQISTDLALTSGNNNVAVTIPCDASVGVTFARFRLSTGSGLSYTGAASDGEVEDYEVTILADGTDPIISCPSDITVSCSQSSSYADFSAFTSAGGSASDNCLNTSSFTLDSQSSDSGSPIEIFTRYYLIEDDAGNSATCSQTVSVNYNTDLSLTKVVNDNTPNYGDIITFTIVVTNNGPCTVTGVKVEDIIQTGLAYVSYTATTGTYDDSTGEWDLSSETMYSGETETLTVTVSVGNCGSINNFAEIISSSRPDPDSTPDNNQ